MALQKTLIEDTTVSNEYHRVVSITADVGQGMTVAVASYVNSAARQAGAAPIKIRKYLFIEDVGSGGDYTELDGLRAVYIQTLAYSLLKSHADFSGALDV